MATPLHEIRGQPHSGPDADEPAVWIVDGNNIARPDTRDGNVLSPSECARADKILDSRKREEFVNTRGLLRHILGRRLELPPERIRLQTGSRGKLECAQLRGQTFSVSHSHGLSAIAIAPAVGVGVDVERIIERTSLDRIARRFLSRNEYRCWSAVDRRRRLEAFYELWTRKEAYLKALGTGLFNSAANAGSIVPLPTEFSSTAATASAVTVDSGGRQWRWRSLQVPQGYRGAVCWIASP